jgi:O-antigen ligase
MRLLLGLCALVWLPILLHQIYHRGLLVLSLWLLVAPVVINLIHGNTNPFFTSPQSASPQEDILGSTQRKTYTAYKTSATRISLDEVLEPTRTLLGLFLVVFLLSFLAGKKRLVLLDRTEIWMIIFSLLLIASACFQSIRFTLGIHTALDAFIVPFLGYYVARRLVTHEDHWRRLIRVLGYMGFYVIIICLIEQMAHSKIVYKMQGPFNGPAKLQLALIVAFYGVLIEQQALPGSIRRFVLYLTPLMILLTWLRANWVGFLAGGWVFLFLIHRFSTPKQKLRKFGIGLMLIPVVIIGVAALVSQEYIAQEVIENRVAKESTVNWRLLRWQVAIQEGLKHPFFGIGLTNLQDALGRAGLNYATAHTSFLTFFAENGVVGLLVYLALAGSIIQMGWRLYRTGANPQDRWRGAAVIAVVITHNAPSLFYNELHSYFLGHIYPYVFLGGIAGLYSQHPLERGKIAAWEGSVHRGPSGITPARSRVAERTIRLSH